MRSCTGRLESHQRGFWIETLVLCPGDLLSKSSNFFQKKVVGGQSPVNDRHSKAGKFWSWGVDAQEFPGGIPEAKHVLAFCHASFRMTLSWVGFLTLAPDRKQSVVPCPILTVASWPAYRFLRRQVKWSGILISLRLFHNLLWSTQSKTLA